MKWFSAYATSTHSHLKFGPIVRYLDIWYLTTCDQHISILSESVRMKMRVIRRSIKEVFQIDRSFLSSSYEKYKYPYMYIQTIQGNIANKSIQ